MQLAMSRLPRRPQAGRQVGRPVDWHHVGCGPTWLEWVGPVRTLGRSSHKGKTGPRGSRPRAFFARNAYISICDRDLPCWPREINVRWTARLMNSNEILDKHCGTYSDYCRATRCSRPVACCGGQAVGATGGEKPHDTANARCDQCCRWGGDPPISKGKLHAD